MANISFVDDVDGIVNMYLRLYELRSAKSLRAGRSDC